jgi:DNA-binding transcriptional LysR family regulator
MRIMETRRLRQFVVVAEELNFRRAAERLNMAQPPLSVAIQQLESELGTKLFERGKRFVRLTAAGEVFLREANQILNAMERAAALTRSAGAGIVGRLRVGFVPSAAYAFLPAVVRRFQPQFPDVELDLAEGVTPEVMRDVLSGDTDVGLVRSLPSDDRVVETYVAQEERLIVALPAAHPLACRRRVPLSLLRHEDFVASHGMRVPGFRSQIRGACVEAGFEPRVRHEAVTIPTIVSLVSGGMGVALVPQAASSFQHAGVAYRDLTGVATRVQLILVWKRDNDYPVLTNFVRTVRELTGSSKSSAKGA